MVVLGFVALAQASLSDVYSRQVYEIPMRDGVRLHTVVYLPNNVPGRHPILLERTPYSANDGGIRGSEKLRENGYVFAFQDVRGQYLSQGEFVNVRPLRKPEAQGTDESTDTYDTIDWLVKHVPDNNGSVGMWGISYPGFYAAAGAVGTHPALKAVSPQAPVSDWFVGDDAHHNGAFFLQDNFDFSAWFDAPRTGPEAEHHGVDVSKGGLSAYDFFLGAGTAEGLDAKFLKGRVPYWSEVIRHPNYDAYWQDRSLPRRLTDVKCAVLTVGGWFDAEDLWGALNTYAAIERQNPGTPNALVMGPWYHGMWASPRGRRLGDLDFGSNTSAYFQDKVEFPFFEKYLRGQDLPSPAEATVFETGTNRWRAFSAWPPKELGRTTFYLGAGKTIGTSPSAGSDSFENDPAAPTPYIADYAKSKRRPLTYVVDDQRWAEKRRDVVTYKGEPLAKDWTVAGPIDVDFWVVTTGTDMDLVVKVIDAYPDDAPEKSADGDSLAGHELNVRADVFRGRFRDSYEKPVAFVPGQPAHIRFKMNDLLHTFKKGHRLVVQVQGSWFPLVDRNPNRFVPNVELAKPEDFQKATITVLHDAEHPTKLTFGTLP